MKDKQQTNFQNIIFLILLAFITGLLAYILKPFFFAVFWAVPDRQCICSIIQIY